MALQPSLGLSAFFIFLILYTAGKNTWWGISTSQFRYLHRKQYTQTDMELEPTNPLFGRLNTDRALLRAATLIG
jgi:hypothetical protein